MDHQITLDRNQKEEALKSMMEQGTDLSPKAGVLTRTVVRSPVINWIIPARVRHKDKNDVIFIGETFIHIRELRKDRHLYDVVIKSDFGAKILHARIFGESRTTEDAEDTKTEPSGVDTGIRDDIPDLSSDCVESVLGQPKLPPQFLVLSLDTGKLVFLFAYSTTDGSIEFVTRVRSLQSRMTELQVPGKHIAVDPKSRAMAVSLQQDAFLVYALAPREELRQKVEHDNILDHDGFDPVREERYVKVDGIIMKLDFLYSEESNEDRVVLVLVISKNKQLFIWTFEWDSTQSLRNAREQQDAGYRLPPDDGLPSLLIPLTFLNAFVLVYKNKLRALTYGNVSSTNTQERTVDKSKVQAISQSPFGSNKHDSPLWTSWARPLRSKSYKAEHDDIYLCNQKGSVQVVSHDRGSDLILDLSCPAAEINGSVSTAFASLNLGMDQYDMVIFGGDTSSGASYLITPKQTGPPVRMETVPNWSPSEDFVVSEASLHHARIPKTLNPDKAPLRRDRIFASSGTHPYGALTELRFGLEGRVAAFFAYNPRVTGIWGFSDPDGTVAYVLCSELAHTELIMIPEDLNQDRAGAVSNDDVPGLNLDAETLAATLLGDNIIQVTSGTINACSLFDMGTKMEVVEDFRALGKSASIVRAAFHPSSSCLVTVAQGPDGMEVQASYLSIHQG
ncbi:MAG: hypothetical protein M4579_001704 [Chaenotheca gracillima]|nr:MAG: hypothetical protein M4579_001704 [Chaenotheca gracillima]